MDHACLTYLNRLIEIEEKGCFMEAMELIDKLLSAFPDDKTLILLEKAKMEFRNGCEKEALLDFISAYEMSGDGEIYELILEVYYEPNKDNFRQTFDKNVSLLKEYPHYRNEYKDAGEPEFMPIWQDEASMVCLDVCNKQFGIENRHVEMDLPMQSGIAMLLNELWMDDILQCEETCRIEEPFMDVELPFYLVFDQVYWMLFVQLYDMEPLLSKNRVVFLIGRQAFQDYFYEDMVLFPELLPTNLIQNSYYMILSQVQDALRQEQQKNVIKMADYYETNSRQILARIKAGNPRILFLTCRFTTVLQYHTRDCMQAAGRLGCETTLVIEPDGIHRIYALDCIRTIVRFKPDIIFCLDYFRFQNPFVPDGLIWVTWVQDPMSHIMDKGTPLKLTKKDFVMNHFITWEKFKDVGYSDDQLIDAPVPSNQHIYKPYELTEREAEEYGCDICFVCHASDVDNYLVKELQRYPKELWESIALVHKGYQDYVYRTGKFFYTPRAFYEYIKGVFDQSGESRFTDAGIESMAENMYQWFNQRVFRQTLVDWILDAGFMNIKLWGNGWSDNEKYKDYAMGPAENGETLSKIYQSSKIVIGNNIQTTAAARAWESMLSGAFYMSNYIPPEADVCDIRKIVKADEDVVMFRTREDLIQKIHYYLEHEEERQEMIKRGRKAALEKMTFDSLMRRVLKTVGERLEEHYGRQD